MKPIPFTQYLLPDGRREQMAIARPDDVYEKAEKIISAGYRFECEILTTGHVSLTIAGRNTDVEIELCSNGPAVPDAVDRMIQRFDFDAAAEREAEAG